MSKASMIMDQEINKIHENPQMVFDTLDVSLEEIGLAFVEVLKGHRGEFTERVDLLVDSWAIAYVNHLIEIEEGIDDEI